METYGPPVDQLLRIGRIFVFDPEQWFDYRTLGIGPENIPDLIRMAADKDLPLTDPETAEAWAPIHAWRALSHFRPEQAIPALVGIFADQDENKFDEWITEELPEVLAIIGPTAIAELTRLLERDEASDSARRHAMQSLVTIVRRHPETREQVVAILTQLLDRPESHDKEFNAWIVSYLLDLMAKESAEVIERAFAGGFVLEWICGGWYEVWHELKLEGEPPPRPKPLRHTGPVPFPNRRTDPSPARDSDLFRDRIVIQPPPPEGWKPADSRSPVDRKDRNKARQKLEKKVKGKGKSGNRH
jgi:hypothetical protein